MKDFPFLVLNVFFVATGPTGLKLSSFILSNQREPVKAAYERSDVCVVPAAGVVGEAMVALTLAQAALEKFGGDSLGEVKRNFEGYLKQLKEY